MKLIHYPMKLNTLEDINLTENEKTVKAHFKIYLHDVELRAKKNKGKKTYIIVDFDPESLQCTFEIASSFHEFIDPPDFFVYPRLQIQKNHLDMFNFLHNSSAEECYDYFSQNASVLRSMQLYPPPSISVPIEFHYPRLEKKPIDCKDVFEKVIFNGKAEQVPQKCYEGGEEKLQRKYSHIFQEITDIIDAHLEMFPIISDKICKELFQTVIQKIDPLISITTFRRFIRIKCYYIEKGAFFKSWVKFGYDLRKDSSNYKYQRLSKYKMNTKIEFLAADPVLCERIESNSFLYISQSYDFLNGFFNAELIAFLKEYFQKSAIGRVLDLN